MTERVTNMMVRLYRDSTPFSYCKVTYLGMFGLYVKADPLLYLKNMPVTLDLYMDSNNSNKRYQLQAVVTKRAIDGVGLTFVNLNRNVLRELRALIINKKNHNTVSVSTCIPQLV